MTDQKLTDEENILLLLKWSDDLYANTKLTPEEAKTLLALINRQHEEIERLTMKLTSRTDENTILRRYFGIKTDEQVSRIIANYKGVIQTTKSEAIKEFAERLKKKYYGRYECSHNYIRSIIDTLVKEMTEVSNG